MADLTLQDLAWIVGVVLAFAAVGWAWHVAREAGVSPWAALTRYVAVRIEQHRELVLEAERTSADAGSASSPDPVPGHTYQLEPQEPTNSEPARDSIFRQHAREDVIVMLAMQRNADGGYLWSANQITGFVGGTAAPVKATIAAVRGKKETPPPAQSLQRPAKGW